MVRPHYSNLALDALMCFCKAQPCDEDGFDLPLGASPSPPLPLSCARDDYYPYDSQLDFELVDFLFRKVQMSGNNIDELMQIWAAQRRAEYGDIEADPPFANAQDMYNVIDATTLGDVAWQAFSVKYNGEIPDNAPNWMSASYEVWFRDPLAVMEAQLGNPEFANEMDYSPKRVLSMTNKRQFSDFMSGNWSWNQAVWFILCHCHFILFTLP